MNGRSDGEKEGNGEKDSSEKIGNCERHWRLPVRKKITRTRTRVRAGLVYLFEGRCLIVQCCDCHGHCIGRTGGEQTNEWMDGLTE